MSNPIPYLFFDGNCAEAMQFHADALGGKLESLVRGRDSPLAEQLEGRLDLVLHAHVSLPGGGAFFGGDAGCGAAPYEGIKGVTLTLNYATVAEAERAFATLSVGGKVTMPLQPTFWAKIWAMFVDRYGTPWMINGELLSA
ncbi:MAG: VOC family protein [Gammaproteobacteria bacterium]